MTEHFQYPEEGSIGTESDWQTFELLNVPSGSLMVGDFSFIPSVEDCLVVRVTPGQYIVAARVIAYAGDQRLSRLRLTRSGGQSFQLAEQLGDTWTDTARTGVCDYERYRKAFDRLMVADNWDEYMGEAEDEAGDGVVVLDEAEDARMVFVPSGFGDGSFPVYALRDGDELIGIEVEFIEPTTPYPFPTHT